MTFLEIIFYTLLEGLTEFLPISSTAHLVILSYWMQKENDPFIKSFEIIIQFGAIFSVLVVYHKIFFSNFEFYKKLFAAFLPTAIIGFALKSYVDVWLSDLNIVAWALILGGIILIASDSIFKSTIASGKSLSELSYKDAIKLGLCQCFALVPGVSRSGATIIGALSLGYNKKASAEFSFFLAVPTIAAASAYKFLKIAPTLTSQHISYLALGLVLSFVFAVFAIRFFISLISRFGFKHFGIYRIILGLILIWTLQHSLQ